MKKEVKIRLEDYIPAAKIPEFCAILCDHRDENNHVKIDFGEGRIIEFEIHPNIKMLRSIDAPPDHRE